MSIELQKVELVYVPLDELLQRYRCAFRIRPDDAFEARQLQRLYESIKAGGVLAPLIATQDRVIIDGARRYHILKQHRDELKDVIIPVYVVPVKYEDEPLKAIFYAYAVNRYVYGVRDKHINIELLYKHLAQAIVVQFNELSKADRRKVIEAIEVFEGEVTEDRELRRALGILQIYIAQPISKAFGLSVSDVLRHIRKMLQVRSTREELLRALREIHETGRVEIAPKVTQPAVHTIERIPDRAVSALERMPASVRETIVEQVKDLKVARRVAEEVRATARVIEQARHERLSREELRELAERIARHAEAARRGVTITLTTYEKFVDQVRLFRTYFEAPELHDMTVTRLIDLLFYRIVYLFGAQPERVVSLMRSLADRLDTDDPAELDRALMDLKSFVIALAEERVRRMKEQVK